MTKPKLIIPPLVPKTPEQIELHKEITLLNDLYIRWVTNTLLPEDDFLLITHMDQLKLIKEREDLYYHQMQWKMAEFTRNSTPRNENN